MPPAERFDILVLGSGKVRPRLGEGHTAYALAGPWRDDSGPTHQICARCQSAPNMALPLSWSLHPTEWTHAALAALREHWERLMIDMDRRTFMEGAGAGIAYAATASAVPALAESAPHEAPTTTVSLTVNGKVHTVTVEDRTTLLDALRNQIGLSGTKKSCDRGECGACTVHIDGHRALACMSLAAIQKGRSITTIEGVANGSKLHPLQAAFIEHDGFQCGFCTSGQIMSGVALLKEARSGWPSAATPDVTRPFSYDQLSEAEIRERMSGNLCRCACYPNIVDSIASAAKEG